MSKFDSATHVFGVPTMCYLLFQCTHDRQHCLLIFPKTFPDQLGQRGSLSLKMNQLHFFLLKKKISITCLLIGPHCLSYA